MKITKHDIGSLFISIGIILVSYTYDTKLAIIVLLFIYGDKLINTKT